MLPSNSTPKNDAQLLHQFLQLLFSCLGADPEDVARIVAVDVQGVVARACLQSLRSAERDVIYFKRRCGKLEMTPNIT